MEVIQFIKDLFMLKFLPQLGNDTGLVLLFVLGLLTSFHCVAMCGGILLSQTTVKENESDAGTINSKKAWFKPSLLYNAGRVVAYTFVGGVVGGIGMVISLTGVWKGLIPLIGGLFMVIMGINLLGIFPFLRRLNIRMPYFAAKKIKSKSGRSPLYIGLLTGLMPCGPLQIVQLYALSTGSVLQGAVSMLVFSLGTVPLLFTFGALNTIMNKKFAHRMVKVSAIFVIVLGIIMMGRGLALSGISVNMPATTGLSGTEISAGDVAKVSGDVQIIETSITSDSFPPITVKKGVPVRWTIKADPENLNSCNNAIVIPEYNIEMGLEPGDNLVEFLPTKEGEFIYTCWMGMIKSSIHVVAELEGDVAGNQANAGNPDKGDNTAADSSGMMDQACTEAAMDMDRSADAGTGEAAKPDAQESVEEKTTELKGYLIDKHCFDAFSPFDQITPAEDTRACLTMEECAASGYGIAVLGPDGQYTFYMFDSGGQKTASDYLTKTEKNIDFGIRVIGMIKDDKTFTIKSFDEI